MSSHISLYRGLYRELRQVARIGQGTSPDFIGMLRATFATPQSPKELHDAREILLFLRSQRKYTELLERYNPGATMTQAERNRLTARRVGLQLPKLNSDDFFNKK